MTSAYKKQLLEMREHEVLKHRIVFGGILCMLRATAH